ncbi:DUF423 domain-containing protein [Arhodomonas sp. AD133]|uniref:DUF423 domain-containing protein n=1 Tax=Arhodomonas sp. AD133 TaxID=3415009 RepID=UPI003EB7DEE0
MDGRAAMVFGALAGLVGVVLGAFGAHALSGMLSPERLEVWETAVRYQFVHALALVFIGTLHPASGGAWLRWSTASLMAGVIVFCGSLYLLCLTGVPWLGAITPIGGVLWVVGWALLAVYAVRHR